MTRGGIFAVVAELEIGDERHRLRRRDDTVGLEKQHGEVVAGVRGAADELGEHVEGDLDVGDGVDEPDGDNQESRDTEAKEERRRRCARWVRHQADETEHNGDHENQPVPPFRNLFVHAHQAVVDIFALVVLPGTQ